MSGSLSSFGWCVSLVFSTNKDRESAVTPVSCNNIHVDNKFRTHPFVLNTAAYFCVKRLHVISANTKEAPKLNCLDLFPNKKFYSMLLNSSLKSMNNRGARGVFCAHCHHLHCIYRYINNNYDINYLTVFSNKSVF